jgi:hypothetical protein
MPGRGDLNCAIAGGWRSTRQVRRNRRWRVGIVSAISIRYVTAQLANQAPLRFSDADGKAWSVTSTHRAITGKLA